MDVKQPFLGFSATVILHSFMYELRLTISLAPVPVLPKSWSHFTQEQFHSSNPNSQDWHQYFRRVVQYQSMISCLKTWHLVFHSQRVCYNKTLCYKRTRPWDVGSTFFSQRQGKTPRLHLILVYYAQKNESGADSEQLKEKNLLL